MTTGNVPVLVTDEERCAPPYGTEAVDGTGVDQLEATPSARHQARSTGAAR